ncbi:MAG TPA: phosphate/phosphite/phosphonate ABC transporter substrate-binding protein [Chloroflexi bacterium]|nr:phosphate/phosphite/phosphonate ABC transporter substrate-binding protein [Chloroflexota bacterium]
MLKSKKWLILLALVAVAALGMAACTPPEPELGSEENPVIISFVPSADADTVLASATAITDVLSEKTGLTIKAEVPTSYVASIEAMCNGEAHAGALNTFSYVVAHERGCADVALVSIRFGSPTYSGQIITRADSGITSLEDLKGKTFCRPDAFSTSGWIIPSIAMRAAGVDPDNDLAEVIDAGGHTGVVRAVYDGDCDAGATFVDARSNVAEELPDVNDVVVVIETSPPIPNDTISFHPDVPAEVRDAIVDAFLEMASNEEELAILEDLYSWAGLEKVDDSFYDGFRQMLEASGVDVTTFIEE